MHAAAAEFGVPENVLLSVSYHETRWDNHHGAVSADGGYGLMHLTTAVPRPDGRGRDGDPAHTLDGPAQQTLARASRLLGVDPAGLRGDDRQNIRGGAALLAQYARDLNGGHLPTAVGDWYGAVARYSGATDAATAALFADDVYATIQSGQSAAGLRLAAAPDVRPRRDQLSALHLRSPAAGSVAAGSPAAGTPATAPAAAAECPAVLRCAFIPAAYAQNSADPGDYGNQDLADRPHDIRIQYIVIHDTEGSYAGTISEFQNPQAFVSAHYVIRSSDGAITQMVPTHNVAWHAGNWWLNMHSIGIEHEGVAIDGASWYTEAMYRSSAALVRYLAARFHIPLDRQHIIGHDNVVGPTPGTVAGMHWDPGPYWDWNHYFDLLHAPTPRPGLGLITIDPRFATNRPVVTDCTSGQCVTQPSQGTSFLYLHTQPSDSAPLLSDPAIHPDGSPGTTAASDWSDKAVAGQQFAIGGLRPGWFGVWFGGQLGWLRTGRPDVRLTCGAVVTPRRGLATIPVYGRAYPEAAAYDGTGIAPQPVTVLQYTIAAGQRYPTIGRVPTDYYSAVTFNSVNTLVTGRDPYYQISFNHRIAFVRAADVTVVRTC
jgi:hypothetical protein